MREVIDIWRKILLNRNFYETIVVGVPIMKMSFFDTVENFILFKLFLLNY